MAWCVEREDWRTFRLDRMRDVTASTWRSRRVGTPIPPSTSRTRSAVRRTATRHRCGSWLQWPRCPPGSTPAG
ncbi:WYL domain-containing protein [Nocardioides sp.]|uniref:WYL domain-containing protein n=1 Tax=Nocardioides sp. TaxID=35761 RepID=UPI00344B4471